MVVHIQISGDEFESTMDGDKGETYISFETAWSSRPSETP